MHPYFNIIQKAMTNDTLMCIQIMTKKKERDEVVNL